jgi:hypothetical protein
VGALSEFRGFGGIIASNNNFYNDNALIQNFGNFDKWFELSYEGYSDIKLPQSFFFPADLGGDSYYFAIRAKKQYTEFLAQNRSYDRREYFFFDFEAGYNNLDFAQSLPEMKQYAEKQYGTEPTPKIKKHKYNPDKQISNAVLSQLLRREQIKITANEKTNEKIINAISAFPACYKKYLGFGFNVKDDDFSNSRLHIFSILDGAIDIETIKQTKVADDLKKCAEFLLSNKDLYPDTELQLLQTPLTKDALYTLLDYHKLHYQLDNNVVLETEEKFKIDLKKYVSDLKAKKEDKYIKERFLKIKKFAYSNKWLDLFKSIEVDDAQTKKMQAELEKKIRDITIETIEKTELTSKDQAFALLKENPSEKKKIKIVNYCEPDYLFDKIENYLDDPIICKAIKDLLEKATLETKLKWKKKYPNCFQTIFISVTETDNLTEFSNVCTAFENCYLAEYKNIVKTFVQDSINLSGDRELKFYQKAFKTAKKCGFKITVKNPSTNLFEYYKLFKNNAAQTENDILDTIADSYIQNDFPKTVTTVLDFAKDNKDFVEKHKPAIIVKLVELSNFEKYNWFVAFLKEKENVFLQDDNKLCESFSYIEKLDKKQCFELNDIKHKTKKIPPHLATLIDNIIDNNIKKIEMTKRNNKQDKPKGKNSEQQKTQEFDIKSQKRVGNIIEYSTKRVKVVAAIFFALFVGVMALCIVQFATKTPATNKNIKAGENNTVAAVDSLQYLKNEVQKLEQYIDLLINLQPYPNDTLSKSDLAKLWNKDNKSDSVALGLPVDSVVKIIFTKNPKDIKLHYKQKAGYYEKMLIKQNPNCFDVNSVLKDSIKLVPSYKAK